MAVGVAALAAGCGGGGARTTTTTTTTTAATPLPISAALKLTVRSPAGLVTLGRTARLRARVPASTGRIELWSYPLGHERDARREAIGDAANAPIDFTVRPERSRAYELHAGGRRSNAALVGVRLHTRLLIAAVGARGAHVRLDLSGPAGLRPNTHAKLYLYYMPQGSDTLRRVAVAHLRAAPSGHIVADWRITVARRHPHDRFYACAREPYAAGFGLLSDSEDGQCSQPTLAPGNRVDGTA
jgi:hypothetical protein